MRIPFFILAVIVMAAALASRPQADGRLADALLADAQRDAAVGVPQEIRINDNFGDPDEFVKYMIRKPPVFA